MPASQPVAKGMQPILDTYRKDPKYGSGHGYGRQTAAGWTGLRIANPTSVIIHATHGRAGSRSAAEAAFLRDSPDVSAHYLVGRLGEVYRILPDTFVAWHAGECLPAFTNPHSIGIELHAAVTEPITGAQKQALAGLLRQLVAQWHIPAPLIDSHRAVALPPGRKSDPATWPQAELRAWIDGALTCDAPPPA